MAYVIDTPSRRLDSYVIDTPADVGRRLDSYIIDTSADAGWAEDVRSCTTCRYDMELGAN